MISDLWEMRGREDGKGGEGRGGCTGYSGREELLFVGVGDGPG